jgi:hypothetical protein
VAYSDVIEPAPRMWHELNEDEREKLLLRSLRYAQALFREAPLDSIDVITGVEGNRGDIPHAKIEAFTLGRRAGETRFEVFDRYWQHFQIAILVPIVAEASVELWRFGLAQHVVVILSVVLASVSIVCYFVGSRWLRESRDEELQAEKSRLSRYTSLMRESVP